MTVMAATGAVIPRTRTTQQLGAARAGPRRGRSLPGPYPPQGPPGRGPRDGGGGRGGASRVAVTIVVVLVIAALVATALIISNSLRNSGGSKQPAAPSTKPTSSAPATAAVLKPVSDSTFNIFGNDSEDAQDAPQAIDNSLQTAWATDYYKGSPNFGGLKPGTGLLLDMGHAVKLSQVEVLFGSQCCTTAEIYLGNSSAMSKTALNNFTKVAPSATVSGNARLHRQQQRYRALRTDLDHEPAAHAGKLEPVPGADLQHRGPRNPSHWRRLTAAGQADGT